MILQFDVGNTRLKWRLINDREVFARGSSRLDQFKMSSLCLDGGIDQVQLAAVRQGREFDALVEDISATYPELDIYQAAAAERFGPVRFAYENPETQGVDRCLAMLAAYSLVSECDRFVGVMVIDAGSAVTVDVLNESGEQVEGYILPGLEMMREALLGKTSKIADGYRFKQRVVGALSTRECVDRGVMRAFIESMRGFVGSAKAAGLDLVITGGDASNLKDLLASEDCYFVGDLVLDGLFILATKGWV